MPAGEHTPPPAQDRPAYRLYTVQVARREQLTPHFVRITFRGEDLRWFGVDLLDQRIKLIFPLPGIGYSEFGQWDPESGPDWYRRIRALPAEQRNPWRTYTVRAVRPDARELDIDFVDHGALGPAGTWLEGARPGDELVIVGPDVRSQHSRVGIDWNPGAARSVLLAGDETAVPAICSILELVADDVDAHAFVEVPAAADTLPPARRADAIRWIAREDRPRGAGLLQAVEEFLIASPEVLGATDAQELPEVDVDTTVLWEVPAGATQAEGTGHFDGATHVKGAAEAFYAWVAGESAMVKELRRHLVRTVGVPRGQVAFMGYWRAGRAEPQA